MERKKILEFREKLCIELWGKNLSFQHRNIPWIIKYRPKTLSDIVNQDEAKNKVLEWLKKWPNVQRKALLLYGPPGCGKTSLVEAIANEFGYELIEMNASDFRRRSDIERIAIRAAGMQSIFGKTRKIILLDEVDGISAREDEGGIEAIKQLVEKTSVPIIMTANNPYDPNLRILREIAEMVQFKKLSKNDMRMVLNKICRAENIRCDEEAIDYIIERAEGDLRASINDLQAVGEGFGEVTLERAKILLRPRDKEKDPFETLRAIFSSNYAWQARAVTNQTQLDHEQLKLWLEENIPIQYTDVEDMARAFDMLSKADVFLGRIVRTGDWDLLVYAIDLMTAGVALSAKNNVKDKYRWNRYNFPRRIQLMSKLKDVRDLRDDAAKLLSTALHISSATAINDVIPFLRAIFQLNLEYGAKIALGLGLSEKMIEFLASVNKSEALQIYRELKKSLKTSSETISSSQPKKELPDKSISQRSSEAKEKQGEDKKSRTGTKDLLSFKK